MLQQKARGSRHENRFVLLFGWLFVLAGLICLVLGIRAAAESHRFRSVAQPSPAVILAIRDKSEDSLGTPVISYVVNGAARTGELHSVSGDMAAGMRLTVHFDPADPSDVRILSHEGLLPFGLLSMSAVYLFFGTLVIVVRGRSRRRVERLLAQGQRLEARIVSIDVDEGKLMDGRHPLIITCETVDARGRTRTFRSGSLWRRPDEIDRSRRVFVYVDIHNPANYFVDGESAVASG